MYNPYAPSYMQTAYTNPYQPQPAPSMGQFGMQPQQQQPMTPRTNKVLVAGLQDALSRTNEPNTELLFVDQDNPFIYLISVDMQGRKTYKTFQISEYTAPTEPTRAEIDMSMFVTKDEFAQFREEMKASKPTRTRTTKTPEPIETEEDLA